MTTRVKGSILIGFALVASALVLSQYRGGIAPQAPAQAVTDANNEPVTASAPKREAIPVVDSNNDGVPDWQELLNDTEPLVLPDEDSFAQPETVTGQFALEFFETYVSNEGYGAFARSPEEIVDSASDSIIQQTRDRLYTEQDIKLYAASPEQIRQYANAVADIMFAYPLPEETRNEIVIMEEAVTRGNRDALAELTPIQRSYESMVSDMLALPVPRTLMKEHLDLTNVYQALASSIAAMQNTYEDPLPALVRLRRYQDDVIGLNTAIENLFSAAYNQDADFQPGDSVFNIVRFEE